MTKLILIAALVVAGAAPAQAHPVKRHHHYPADTAAASYPDSVTLEGKEYKVCKPGMEDDCVQAHQAGLGVGKGPAHIHHRHPRRHR